MSHLERRYWDSNVFLAWIKGEKGRAETVELIVKMARKEECVIVTSAIALSEVVRPRQKGAQEMTEAEDKKIVAFFSNPFIKFVDLTPPLAAKSRHLQWKFNLSVRDSIHIVSAIAAQADVIETYDPDLSKVDRASVPGCPPIRQPKTKELPLFPDEATIQPATASAPTAPPQPSAQSPSAAPPLKPSPEPDRP